MQVRNEKIFKAYKALSIPLQKAVRFISQPEILKLPSLGPFKSMLTKMIEFGIADERKKRHNYDTTSMD